MASYAEANRVKVEAKEAHLQAAIGSVGNYLLCHLKRNIDDEETCEYQMRDLDEKLEKLCEMLLTVPSEKRILDVWEAIGEVIEEVPLSMTATTKLAIGFTEARIMKARAQYSKHHEDWLDAYMARDERTKEAQKTQDAHRLMCIGVMKESGKNLFFQRTVLKLWLDVQQMVEDIKAQQAYHETHCLRDVNVGQS